MPEIRFDRAKIIFLLEKLSDRLALEGLRGEVLLFGGAALILGWQVREATRDVDAVFVPADKIRLAAARVAESENLPKDWLNDAVKGFLDQDIPRADQKEVLEFTNLAVYVPPVEYLVATKAFAARSGAAHADVDDLKFLIREARLKSAEEVLEIVERYYPSRLLPAKTRFFVESIFEEINKNQ